VLDGDMKALAASGEKGLMQLMAVTHAGMTSDGGTCARCLPENAVFMPKPWNALDILIQAQRAVEHGYH